MIHRATIDFYSLAPGEGLRYRSPELPEGDYILRVTVRGHGGIWFNKAGQRFGSRDCFVRLTGWASFPKTGA